MNRLNALQQAAAHEPGSVVITAGAGTGKTHVLAERYYHLLATNETWSPLNVVAVTFTQKAADELRSRIRETIIKNGSNPRTVAEVEAAQISTIHSLAARICRDFYDIAGIPADFRLMDKNESTLWTLGKLEEAIGKVCEAEARELGYTFLLDALSQLVGDPYTAEKALANSTADHWRQTVGGARDSACETFLEYLGDADCIRRLRELSGGANDTIELQRRNAIAAVDSMLERCFENANLMDQIILKGGSKNNWPDGHFAETKACLTELRDKTREFLSLGDLKFGPADEEMLAQIKIIGGAFAKASEYLAEAKLADKFLDYNDLETYAVKVLKNAGARSHYGERWKAFLVDEFQDTNPVQAELLALLTAGANLTIVGDENQSIYGFRGADAEVFGRFSKSIIESGGASIKLEETYRANSSLVNQMNQVFEPLLPIVQPLISGRDYAGTHSEPIRIACVESDEREKALKQNIESRHLARVIRQMVEDKTSIYDKAAKTHRAAEYRDCAILSRVWEPLETYGDAFAAEGIPAVNAGGGTLTNTREFKDAFALLTFLADQLDDLSLAAVLRSPFFAVSDRALYTFSLTVGANTSWWPVLKESQILDSNLSAARDCLVRLIKERVHHTPEGLLRFAAGETSYAAVIANLPHGGRREADWHGVLKFVRGLQEKGWEDLFSVARYMRIAVRSDLDIERPTLESGNAVALMTIHAAKGLEWPIVFLPDLSRPFQSNSDTLAVDGELGVTFSWENDSGEKVEPSIYKVIKQRARTREEAERRRLLYVAITRAGDFVHLSSTSSKGASLDLIQPGLNAAGIQTDSIPYTAEDLLPPAPGEPNSFPDLASDTAGVNIAAESVMATGISTYAACPQKYKFQFVDGHPGLGKGSGSAASIGTLAHLALELDLQTTGDLRLRGGIDDDDVLSAALVQANNFRQDSAFAAVRGLHSEKELRFSAAIGDVRVFGIADLVGDDFVLDYKTDAEPDPDKHSFQLWAYARALGKSKAYIAYLRHNLLHEVTAEDLVRLDDIGYDLIRRLRACDFTAAASENTCFRCNYKTICVSAFDVT